MSLQASQSAQIGALQVELTSDGRLRLVGTINGGTAQDELRRFLSSLHRRIDAEKWASITIDVRELNVANSSAVRVFIDWIRQAAQSGYSLSFLTDPNVTWHRLSFSVLKSFAPDHVEIVHATATT